ncbi:hypothetical protein GCWU000342_01599 [Shuttleworthella satelles DSM 14600]|uniref:Uncharacterized protein n=1 Tax=Shuttleworthella satelles DSM 14600 TaxID=626523 RepID=C4GCB0_9FIRM|nr:hypothetical protein GCWU000342_01599 [Shuttleworthia satelles DSM 14600]
MNTAIQTESESVIISTGQTKGCLHQNQIRINSYIHRTNQGDIFIRLGFEQLLIYTEKTCKIYPLKPDLIQSPIVKSG